MHTLNKTGVERSSFGFQQPLFDLNTSISRSLLDLRQSDSASGNVTTNRDTVVTLSAGPLLVHRLSDFADAEWRYRISPVLVSSGDSSRILSGAIRSSKSLTVR